MKWSTTAILIIFAAFVLLLILNPNMSCFGRRIKSPFYPLFRKKRLKDEAKKSASEDRRLWVQIGRSTAAGSFSPESLLIAAPLTACVRRPPVLVPPSGGVEAVEGFGSASVAGVDAAIKGKFGFVFRRPGLGRVEALDPIGRTAFLIFFRDGRAWFVLPGKKPTRRTPRTS